MPTQSKKLQQDLDNLQQQFKEGGDRLVETICEKIRTNPPGQPLFLNFCREIPTTLAQNLTAQAIKITEAEGHTTYGLVIDFEPD